MIFEKFKAKIDSATVYLSKEGGFRMYPSDIYYEFSKRRIYFQLSNPKASVPLGGTIRLAYGQEYTLIRLSKDDIHEWSKNCKFLAEINGQRVAILVNTWNGIKLRIIHERYIIQHHYEWIIKSILYILFGAFIAYYFNNKGFDNGYAKGLENKQSDTLKIHKTMSK